MKLPEQIIKIATSEIGVSEVNGTNCGPRVNEWCVYVHLTADSGEVFYVGQSKRRSQVKSVSFPRVVSQSKRSKWWKNVVSKHGFVAKIISYFATKNDADEEEKRLIKMFGKREDGGILVNLADGGQGNSGSPRTDEWKSRISKAHKGKKLSLEHREKLSLAHIGKKHSEEHKKKIGLASSNHKNFRLNDLDVRAKAQASLKQVKLPPRTREHQDKINAANRGRKRSLESRFKMSISAKKRYEKFYAIAA